jgi:hypothetical protein
MSAQNQGREFEEEFSEEFGLDKVPGSGSVWHSKLDVQGFGVRWSLKFTTRKVCPLSYEDFVEAIDACEGPGGDGSTPMWAARIEPLKEDFIMMRKNDFKLMQAGFTKLLNIIEEDKPQVAARKARARKPELLRDDGDK